MKIKKIILMVSVILGGQLAYADGFPLTNGSQNLNEQPIVLQQPQIAMPNQQINQTNNDVNTNSVPPLTTTSSNIVTSGKTIVNGNLQDGFASASASDQLTQDINNLKKQQKLAELQAKSKTATGVQLINNQNVKSPDMPPIVVKKPITATMIDYVINKKGKTFATIQFMDKSTVEVEKNSIVNGYKVIAIKTDHITLNKIDKTLTGDNTVNLYKSFPVIMSTSNNVTYGNVPQSISMEDSSNLKK